MGNRPSQPLTGVLPSDTTRVRAPSAKPLASPHLEPPAPLARASASCNAGALRAPALASAQSSQREESANVLTHMQIVLPAHALDSGAATVRSATHDRGDSDDDSFAVPESVRKSQTLDAFANVCSEILPQFLYVSNLLVASDAQALQAFGVTHVIDCCSELTCPSPLDARIERLALALRDDVQEDLSWFVYRVIAFIERARCASSASRVLVHCHQGVSRSCALVVAYAMFQQHQQQRSVSFRDALALVKAKRPIASPNTAFLCQLIEWERELATFPLTTASSPSLPVNTLYRLAPHAPHDAATLVLKRCYVPEATAMRTAVVMPLTSQGDNSNPASASSQRQQQQQWLYTRGIFVFLQETPLAAQTSDSTGLASSAAWRVAVWRGRECTLLDGVATAKALVAQMALVRGAAQTLDTSSVDIVEVADGADDSEGAYAGTPVDHFGYTTELEWLTDASVLAAPLSTGRSTTDTEASDSASPYVDESDGKPQLFLFEGFDGGSGAWDHLTDYDADDLSHEGAFLLLQPASRYHFLWLGAACALDRDALVQCAASQVRIATSLRASQRTASEDNDTTSAGCDIEIEVVQSGDESDAFWTAFERGY